MNNSVSKYSKNFDRDFAAENGEIVSGHMWNNDQLSTYLRWHDGGQIPPSHLRGESGALGGFSSIRKRAAREGREVYAELVKPAMSEITLAVLKSVIACDHRPPNRKVSYGVFPGRSSPPFNNLLTPPRNRRVACFVCC